jgi:hypothetical protein
MGNEKKEEQDDRFDVIISLGITKHNKEARENFCQSDVQYFDLDYASMVGIEHLLLEVLNKLGEAGVKSAKIKGLSEKSLLTVLGIVPDGA